MQQEKIQLLLQEIQELAAAGGITNSVREREREGEGGREGERGREREREGGREGRKRGNTNLYTILYYLIYCYRRNLSLGYWYLLLFISLSAFIFNWLRSVKVGQGRGTEEGKTGTGTGNPLSGGPLDPG